jgi:hypothetical protein
LLAEPHFPSHQLASDPRSPTIPNTLSAVIKEEFIKSGLEDLDGGRRLLPPPLALKAAQDDKPVPIINAQLEAVLRGTHIDAENSVVAAEKIKEKIRKADEERRLHVLEESLKESVTLKNGRPVPTAVLLHATWEGQRASVMDRVEDIKAQAISESKKGSWLKSKPCRQSTKTVEKDGRTVTYTYGYSYIKRDYSDVLIVGLVLLFLIAVVLVEMVEKVVDS